MAHKYGSKMNWPLSIRFRGLFFIFEHLFWCFASRGSQVQRRASHSLGDESRVWRDAVNWLVNTQDGARPQVEHGQPCCPDYNCRAVNLWKSRGMRSMIYQCNRVCYSEESYLPFNENSEIRIPNSAGVGFASQICRAHCRSSSGSSKCHWVPYGYSA